jgi:hypothetical protein
VRIVPDILQSADTIRPVSTPQVRLNRHAHKSQKFSKPAGMEPPRIVNSVSPRRFIAIRYLVRPKANRSPRWCGRSSIGVTILEAHSREPGVVLPVSESQMSDSMAMRGPLRGRRFPLADLHLTSDEPFQNSRVWMIPNSSVSDRAVDSDLASFFAACSPRRVRRAASDFREPRMFLSKYRCEFCHR